MQSLEAGLSELEMFERIRASTWKKMQQPTVKKESIGSTGPLLQKLAPSLATVFIAIISLLIYQTYTAKNNPHILARSGLVNVMDNRIDSMEDGYLALRMSDGRSRVEFGPNTKAILTGPRSLTIETGVVWNEVVPDPTIPYVITTPHGAITVLGTAFEVEVTELEDTVRVDHGKVELRNAAFQTVILPAKFSGSIRKDAISTPQKILGKIAMWRSPQINTSDIANALR
jgi:hypothetical protein